MKMVFAHIIILFGLLSCNRDYESTPAMAMTKLEGPSKTRLSAPTNKPVGDFAMMETVLDEEQDSATPEDQALTTRKLIKNGEITITVNSVKKTRAEIDLVCSKHKAYISREDQSDIGNRLQHSLVIRVPATQYDSLVGRIETLSNKVEHKSTTLEDVTEEFIDVGARLKTKKELSARYREILKQARTVDEILSVENHIGNVQAEIESMEGRLKYLNDQISYSTLNVTYYEVKGVDFGFGSKLVSAIKEGWDDLLYFIVALVNLWPFLILIVPGAWLFLKWRKKRLAS